VAFVSDLLAYGGTLLQIVALVLLASGPLTRYFPLFLYIVTLISTTVAELWVRDTEGIASRNFFNLYWGSEILLDLLLLVMILQLTSRALEKSPMRPQVMRLMSGVMAIALIVPFVAFDSEIFGRRWNQSVGQLLNFGAAVMNLALWSALIVSRSKDRQLLKVSAGLGVLVTGAALTLGVRQFTHQDDLLRIVADWVHRVSQTAGPAIWCWAFRPVKKSGAEAPPAIITSSLS
jgi:hypothetical protein